MLAGRGPAKREDRWALFQVSEILQFASIYPCITIAPIVLTADRGSGLLRWQDDRDGRVFVSTFANVKTVGCYKRLGEQ